MSLIILLSFLLLGGTFVGLSYRYTISERQRVLQRNAETVSAMTGGLVSQGMGLHSEYYQLFVTSAAQAAEACVILAENDGTIIYCAGTEDHAVDLTGKRLPASVVNTVAQGNSFSSMSTLGSLLTERHYVAVEPITVDLPQLTSPTGGFTSARAGMVVVAASAASLSDMWRTFTTLYLFSAVVIFFIAFVINSVTSIRFTRPLKQMVEATKKFGHGEFDARVEPGTREDEIYELAVAFNQMAESLAKAEADRSEFIANVSHELKTPMTTIAGFADGILDGTIPPDRQEDALRTVSAETRRLSRLVRRMLDASRIKSAENTLVAQERFDICEVLLRVLVSLEGKVNQHELDVATHLPEDPVHVWGDPDSITQVCYNLLDNAIKFAAPGTTLTLSILSKANKVHVTIRNVGETIPTEELSRVFDRFHKTDRSRSIDREGVGLGLYIVKTILDNHKENISVTSEEGVTEFTFTLAQA